MNGMEVVIDWPAPPMRPWGLATDNYRDLDPFLPEDPVPDRWKNGVKWLPYGCADTTLREVDAECDPIQTFSSPTAFDSFVTMRAFRIETAFECSSLGGLGVDGEDLYKHALEVTAQDRSRQIARQTMFGTVEPSNTDLHAASTVVSTSDTTPPGALAAVENGLATRLNNAQGMIHVSPGMLSYLSGDLEKIGEQWFSPSGHIVVADAGYVGAGGQAGQDWIYGSGIVYYTTDTLRPVSSSWENFDFVNNIVEAQVFQHAIVVFEPCTAVRARSDIVLSPVGI